MTEEIIREIKVLAAALHDEVTAIRRHLHAHPELSFQEYETAAYVSEQLDKWGIAHQRSVGGTGISGLLTAADAGHPCIALRAELDALPITEQNQTPYSSLRPGVMHACGHDVHTACLLGALYILHQLRHHWSGAIRFIFQPGEEQLPGGATLMIRDGVLANPVPDAIIAQHVFVPLRAGQVGFHPGRYMASSDEWYITVKGKGGHAAEPEATQNPIYAVADLLCRLHDLRRELEQAEIPTILSAGTIHAGTATNIVPDEATISGTLRTLDEHWRREVKNRIRQLVQSFSDEHNIAISCVLEEGYPALMNDSYITGLCRQAAAQYVGQNNVHELPVRMASEDFAYYLQQVPGCFFRLGVGNPEQGIISGVHSATFDIDEAALETGTGLLAWLAISLLHQFASKKS